MTEHTTPVMDASDNSVVRILDRAGRLTEAEALALGTAVRDRLGLEPLARRIIDGHQRFLNATAMFEHWPDPVLEMTEARHRVDAALGIPLRHHDAVEPDDGTTAWGAATAAACAALGSGRASSDRLLIAAWWQVFPRW
jgi:hypothetical protein